MSAAPGSTPIATLMSCTSCDASSSAGSTSQVFRILPRSGMTAWNSRSRACFAEPPAESPSTRNSSAHARLLARAVGELARQRRSRDDALARDLVARALQPRLRVLDRELRDALARFRVLVEPQRELVLDDARRRSARSSRDDSRSFVWPAELRLAHLHREHEAHAVPDVLGRELDAARQEIAELAELAHRLASGRAGSRSRACRPASVGIRLT